MSLTSSTASDTIISFCFSLFVDQLDIRTLVTAQTYVIEDSGLVIRDVEKARDEGTYICRASNTAGNRSMTAHLIVNGKFMSIIALRSDTLIVSMRLSAFTIITTSSSSF